ncbi:MAG: DUF4179 domain-containing protein [Oscillibacter sp.]|nr:DUF4179 domain-containing protein [Oscillibacter sp.]
MTRGEEYTALLRTLEAEPEALSGTAQRALARKKTLQKKRHLFGIPAGSLAACFFGFMLLVNLFPTFAHACGRLPVLRELAKAVAWSPSLTAAVENEYVQPIGKSQTSNGITASMEYVIVDQKQVNIFFTLKGDYDNLSADRLVLSPVQHGSVIGADFLQPPGTLLHFTVDYIEEDVPDHLTLTFGVTTWVESENDTEPPAALDYRDELLLPHTAEEPESLAEFTFTLDFDPHFTARGEVLSLDHTFLLDGQTMTLTTAEIYPTHIRFTVEGEEENTAWLKGLQFYLENEQGQRFDAITNGVTASGDLSSPANRSFRLESPYFSGSHHLTMTITASSWLEKERQRVRFDLANQRVEWLPKGVTFTGAEHRENGWILEFRVDNETPRSLTNPWEMTFYDEAETAYDMGASGMSVADGGCEVMLPLPDFHESEVWLSPAETRWAEEPTPVTIAIK